jgi:hypothetical protein
MPDKVTLRLERDLELLLPGFLRGIRKYCDKIEQDAQSRNWHDLIKIADELSRVGQGFDFILLTKYGEELKIAALSENSAHIYEIRHMIEESIQNIEVICLK